MRYFIIAIVALTLWSCQDSGGEIERYDPAELEKEVAYDIEMIYSDSAMVEFRVQSPVLEKYTNEGVLVEEFPAGFLIEYFDEQQNVIFKLSSNYAKRVSEEGLLILRDSVTYVNEKKDILETNALTIDELNNSITTNKFFRLVQGPAKDTIYGRGFSANSDFTSFRVNKYIGKRKGIQP
jgi:LPS export ABC transporter protein LptC